MKKITEIGLYNREGKDSLLLKTGTTGGSLNGIILRSNANENYTYGENWLKDFTIPVNPIELTLDEVDRVLRVSERTFELDEFQQIMEFITPKFETTISLENNILIIRTPSRSVTLRIENIKKTYYTHNRLKIIDNDEEGYYHYISEDEYQKFLKFLSKTHYSSFPL